MTLTKNFRKVIVYSHICLKFSELNTECVGSVLGVTITTSPSLLNPKPCLSSQMKQFSKPWNKKNKKSTTVISKKRIKGKKKTYKIIIAF